MKRNYLSVTTNILAGHFFETLKVRIDWRRRYLARYVDINGRFDEIRLIQDTGTQAYHVRAVGIFAKQLRATIRAKVLFHIRAAISCMLENFR